MQINRIEIITEKLKAARLQLKAAEQNDARLKQIAHKTVRLIEYANNAVEYRHADTRIRDNQLLQSFKLIRQFKMPADFMRRMASINNSDIKAYIKSAINLVQYFLDEVNKASDHICTQIDELNDQIRGYLLLINNYGKPHLLAEAKSTYDFYRKAYQDRANHLLRAEYFEESGQFLEAQVYYEAAALHCTQKPLPELMLLRRTFADAEQLRPSQQIMHLWDAQKKALANVKELRSRSNTLKYYSGEIQYETSDMVAQTTQAMIP